VLSEVYYEKKDLSNDIFLFLFLWMIIFLLWFFKKIFFLIQCESIKL
jgi:hypothetical protein